MKLTKDKKGCVIDVPSKYEEFIEETWVDDHKVTLFKMTELPELEDYDPRRGFGGGNSNYRGNNNGYHNNRSNGGWNNNRSNGGGFKRKSDYSNGGFGAKRTKY